ncbi:hypothetical protein, partial [Bacillus thuringiensis]|uniref:hypothetical protein n=1 Tax=Bacillus thuringiensis TaxID=1428 RepID=UPI002852967E
CGGVVMNGMHTYYSTITALLNSATIPPYIAMQLQFHFDRRLLMEGYPLSLLHKTATPKCVHYW